MISIARHIAAASTSLAILGGSASAQDASTMAQLVELLDLPVGKTATYFNNATKTAVIEECFRQDADTVACNMQVLSNATLLNFTYQGMIYHMKGGDLTITAGTLDQGGWDVNDYNKLFKPAAIQNNHGSWTANSPLAVLAKDGLTVIQNDVLAIDMTPEWRIFGCSSIPVTEYRGVDLCHSFEDKEPIRAKATMTVAVNGAIFSPQSESAWRAFDENFWETAVKYGDNLPKGFMVAPPYLPN